MFRRSVAASVVTVLLALFGIEFSEAAGLINRVDKGRSVESETAGFGVAFRVLDDSRQTLTTALNILPQLIEALADSTVSCSCAASYPGKEAQFLKERLKIHRLNKVLLI